MSEDPLEQALAAAWAHLEHRERTAAEMRRHLLAKGIAPEMAERAIATLAEQEGPLDDGRFARLFVDDKRRLEHWGAERIRRGLLTRGVDPEVVEEALRNHDEEQPTTATAPNRPPELERALELLAQRFRGPLGDDRERNRALGLLLRKGYDSELAYDALRAHEALWAHEPLGARELPARA